MGRVKYLASRILFRVAATVALVAAGIVCLLLIAMDKLTTKTKEAPRVP